MWFDAHATLKKIEADVPATTATTATPDSGSPTNRKKVANVANVATIPPENPKSIKSPDQDAFEERAAIVEHDGWFSRQEAEDIAAQDQGYDNVVAFRAALKI